MSAVRGHGSRIAAWWNIVICGVIIVGAIWFGFTQSAFGFAVAAIGVVLEVRFVMILRSVVREQADYRDGPPSP